MTWIVSFWNLFFLIVIFCGSGQAKTVKCYLCSTKVNETGCLYPESYGMPLVQCDESALHQTTRMANEIRPVTYNKVFAVDTADLSRHLALDCLKVVTKVGNKDFTLRGCQLAEQDSLDICYKIKKADEEFLKVQHCSRCGSNRCNTSSNLSGNHYTLLAILPLLLSSFICV